MKNHKIEFREHLKLDIGKLKDNAQSLCDDMQASKRSPVLKVYIDATHSGRLTNLRVYPGKHMKDAAGGFINPVGKPLLKHHNDESDPIGRVFSSEYVQLIHGPAFDKDYINPSDREGSGFIKLGVNVMDPDAIDKILDGRFKNVSTRQQMESMYCSICGNDMADYDSECGHQPGKRYSLGTDSEDQHLCYGITGPLSYKEVSLVTIPGDAFAEIKAMSFENKDSLSFDLYEPASTKVKSLVLTDGESEVDLLAGIKGKVTAKDRTKLTGKVIVAVSPQFDASKIEQTLINEDSSMTQTETKETKNTPTVAASDSGSAPAQDKSQEKPKEGVVAPEATPAKNPTVGDGGLSEKDSLAVVKSLTSSLEKAEAEAKDAKAESARFQTALKDKEKEIEDLRKQSVAYVSDVKAAYAQMLLNAQIVLKKTVASGIKDSESYSSKLAEYSERTVESLKDSVKDLSIELVDIKDIVNKKSAKDLVADEKIESPAVNTKAVESKNVTNDSSVESALSSFFN